jgi:hypothetical protein
MSKFKVGNPWKTGKTNSERRGIRATDQRALRRRDNGVLARKIEPDTKSNSSRIPANETRETPGPWPDQMAVIRIYSLGRTLCVLSS